MRVPTLRLTPVYPLIYLSALALCTLADDATLRIEEKLTTDKEFYEQWMHLIGLQAEELLANEEDLPPLDQVEQLAHCHTRNYAFTDHADTLRPQDFAIYAEMGHLSVYCKHNYTRLSSGILDSCDHRSNSLELPTMDKMLRVFNPNLTFITANDRDSFLSDQARDIADEISKIDDYENKWKLIVIMPSIQDRSSANRNANRTDGEASETGQTAVEVLETVEELAKRLPARTMVVILRTSGKGIWQDASHGHQACRAMVRRWKVHTQFNQDGVWDQVEVIAQKNFQKSNFSVEILPLLRDAQLNALPEGFRQIFYASNFTDLSALGYDCAHFSARGLSLLHTALWNELMKPAGQRAHQWRPSPQPALCPSPQCPFIRTKVNSQICIWNALEDSPPRSLAPEMIALTAVLVALCLSCLILACLCTRGKTDGELKKKPASNFPTFGADFSSLKFIDEDVA